jgi:hypothetical protein
MSVAFFDHQGVRILSMDFSGVKDPPVCGLRGVGGIAFRALNLLTGSRLRGFDRRDDALAWLVKQVPPAP